MYGQFRRIRPPLIPPAGLAAMACLWSGMLLLPVQAGEAGQSYADAHRIVRSALVAHGGTAPIEAAGGLVLAAEGKFDLTARLQGRSPFRPDPTPISERITVDMAGRLAYDVTWFNYTFSRQDLREVYDGQRRVLYVDKRNRTADWLPFAAGPDAQERYKRFLPQFVLSDALARRATLRVLGESRYAGRRVHVVGYVTAAGEHLTLYIDRSSAVLRGAAAVIDMEILGDTEVRWTWSDYRRRHGMLVPVRLQVHLAGHMLKDVRLTVRLGAPSSAFDPPAGIHVEPPPEKLKALSDLVPYGAQPGEARELAPGVHIIPNLRPGFHMVFVEFKDFVLAVDAPTGWYEVQQIPPANFSSNEGGSALGAKYIRIIKQTVPDKPIRFVALTHHHSDHIGGIRPFIAEGATILATEAAAALARRAADRPHTLWPDALTGSDATPKIEIVNATRVISDGQMEVRLIELPKGNPKADGFLVVYLPGDRIMYLTSFLYPVPEAVFPLVESVPLSLWFIRWLDRSGLAVDRLYNVHGQAKVQDWQLRRLREMLASGTHNIAGE